jgi:anti-sigma B factor antagonist
VNDQQIGVASFAGEIDFMGREDFRAKLALLADAEGAVVDLSEVTYLDSSALAEILMLQRRRKHTGKDGLSVVVNQRIRRLFEITGLQNVLLLAASLDEAKALL